MIIIMQQKKTLKYFKLSFETILFDENFLKIFDYKKIKEIYFLNNLNYLGLVIFIGFIILS